MKLHGGVPRETERRPCCQDVSDDTVLVFLVVFEWYLYLVVLRCDVKVFWSQELYQLRQPGTLQELRLDSINPDKYCTTYWIELVNCCMPYQTEGGHFIAAKYTFTLPLPTFYSELQMTILQCTRGEFHVDWTDFCCSLFSFLRHNIISTPFQFWQRRVL